jgi:hypothetical protein
MMDDYSVITLDGPWSLHKLNVNCEVDVRVIRAALRVDFGSPYPLPYSEMRGVQHI